MLCCYVRMIVVLFLRLVCFAVMHVCSYDRETDKQDKKKERKEERKKETHKGNRVNVNICFHKCCTC